MKQLEYDAMVMQLAKPGVDIASQITPLQAHQLHMAVGVAGESGELLDAIKKHVVYRKPLDIQNVIEELGDLEFYMSGLRQSIGVTREVTLTRNYHKLMMKRYPNGYTDQAAQDRTDKAEPSAKEVHPSFTRLLDLRGNVTQSTLAAELGESIQTISNWASRGVSKAGALAAQRRYGISATYILADEENSLPTIDESLVPKGMFNWYEAGKKD